ncbi:pilus assembly protein PilE [Marinobacterium iners]|nr:pilus assembly protein PilE [Marinobacterium iners]
MKYRAAGFTLIEVLIAVLIIGILASIAYPAYLQYVESGRRKSATSCLSELAQYMEQAYARTFSYSVALPLNETSCDNDLQLFYSFQFAQGQPTQTTYNIQAVPVGAQSGDACGTLSLNQAGQTTPTTSGCQW